MPAKKKPTIDSTLETLFRQLSEEILELKVNLTKKMYHKQILAKDLRALITAFKQVNKDFAIELEKPKKPKKSKKKTTKKKAPKVFDIPSLAEHEVIRQVDHLIDEV